MLIGGCDSAGARKRIYILLLVAGFTSVDAWKAVRRDGVVSWGLEGEDCSWNTPLHTRTLPSSQPVATSVWGVPAFSTAKEEMQLEPPLLLVQWVTRWLRSTSHTLHVSPIFYNWACYCPIVMYVERLGMRENWIKVSYIHSSNVSS